MISELKGEKEVIHLELREVRAELALSKAKLQRAEHGGWIPDPGCKGPGHETTALADVSGEVLTHSW